MPKAKPELRQIPVDQLIRGQYQPRRAFDPIALEELAESIKSAGLIQPLVIRPVSNSPSSSNNPNTATNLNNQYEIIAGERRWRAAQLAGLDSVPCLIRDITDEQAAAVTTIENIQRQDLNSIEEAQAYSRLVEEFKYHHDEVAAIVGKSRTKVTNAMRLLKLEPRIQQLWIDKQLSGGHGKVIAGLPEKIQFEIAQKCIKQEWSVRKIEAEAKRFQQQGRAIQSAQDPNVARLETVVSDQFGAQVKLDPDLGKTGGWLKIKYFDNETLAGLLDKMGVEYEWRQHYP